MEITIPVTYGSGIFFVKMAIAEPPVRLQSDLRFQYSICAILHLK